MAAISLQNVSKCFGKTEVIRQVALDIEDGEFCVFVGPSGCGKSTLLRLIAGLEEASAGGIHFDRDEVTAMEPAERGVAMVFQSYALYPHMSVYDNMAFGLKIAKTDKQSVAERVELAAQTLQIEHLLQRKPRELSGGQRQRVAIGRAIVRQPRVFLFDEPLSNLDAALRVQMRLELQALHRKLGTTMIYVTHDQVEAMTLADRIVVLNEGKVEQVGAPLELYKHPCNLFVAGFIGSPKMNFLAGEVTQCDSREVTVTLRGGATITVQRENCPLGEGQAVTLGLRPEHVRQPAGSAGDIDGEVIAVEHLGAESFVHLDYGGDEPLVFKCATGDALRVGDCAAAVVPENAIYLFDDKGERL